MEIAFAEMQSQMFRLCHGISWQPELKHLWVHRDALIVPREQTNRHPLPLAAWLSEEI